MDLSTLFDAHSIVGDLGLIGVLAIIFAETALLVGLAFPGDSLLFIAGVAASGSGAAILGGAALDPVALFIGAPIAAIVGAQVGHLFALPGDMDIRIGRSIFFLLGAGFSALVGAQVGHLFGATYGRKLFDRPDGRFFNHQKVMATEKWLRKYGTGRAIILARFVPFVRTLINPLCGIVKIPARTFFIWNFVG